MIHSLAFDIMKSGCFPKSSLAVRPDLVKQPVYSAAGSNPSRLGGPPSLIRVRGEKVKACAKQKGKSNKMYSHLTLTLASLPSDTTILLFNFNFVYVYGRGGKASYRRSGCMCVG